MAVQAAEQAGDDDNLLILSDEEASRDGIPPSAVTAQQLHPMDDTQVCSRSAPAAFNKFSITIRVGVLWRRRQRSNCDAQGLGMGLGGPSWSLPAFVDSLPLQPSQPLTGEALPLVRSSTRRCCDQWQT